MLAMVWNRSGTYYRTGLVVGYGGTWRARPAPHRWVTAAGGGTHTQQQQAAAAAAIALTCGRPVIATQFDTNEKAR